MSFSLEKLWGDILIRFCSLCCGWVHAEKQGVHDYFADTVVVHEHLYEKQNQTHIKESLAGYRSNSFGDWV